MRQVWNIVLVRTALSVDKVNKAKPNQVLLSAFKNKGYQSSINSLNSMMIVLNWFMINKAGRSLLLYLSRYVLLLLLLLLGYISRFILCRQFYSYPQYLLAFMKAYFLFSFIKHAIKHNTMYLIVLCRYILYYIVDGHG